MLDCVSETVSTDSVGVLMPVPPSLPPSLPPPHDARSATAAMRAGRVRRDLMVGIRRRVWEMDHAAQRFVMILRALPRRMQWPETRRECPDLEISNSWRE